MSDAVNRAQDSVEAVAGREGARFERTPTGCVVYLAPGARVEVVVEGDAYRLLDAVRSPDGQRWVTGSRTGQRRAVRYEPSSDGGFTMVPEDDGPSWDGAHAGIGAALQDAGLRERVTVGQRVALLGCGLAGLFFLVVIVGVVLLWLRTL